MADSLNLSRRVIQEAVQSARRIVVDDVPWLVYELPPFPFDRRSTPSLVFENENVMRLVRNFPADWRALSDEKLLEVSWKV